MQCLTVNTDASDRETYFELYIGVIALIPPTTLSMTFTGTQNV